MALTDLNERRNRKGFAKLLLRSWISSVSIVTKLVAGRPQEWDRLSAEYTFPVALTVAYLVHAGDRSYQVLGAVMLPLCRHAMVLN